MTGDSTKPDAARSLSNDDVNRLCEQLRDRFPDRPAEWDQFLNSREPSIQVSREEWAERLAGAEPRTEDDVPWRSLMDEMVGEYAEDIADDLVGSEAHPTETDTGQKP